MIKKYIITNLRAHTILTNDKQKQLDIRYVHRNQLLKMAAYKLHMILNFMTCGNRVHCKTELSWLFSPLLAWHVRSAYNNLPIFTYKIILYWHKVVWFWLVDKSCLYVSKAIIVEVISIHFLNVVESKHNTSNF